MVLAYLGVGSNLGNREEYLRQARELLQKIPSVRFLRSSTIYETDPVGGPPQGKYLNAVWEIETRLPATELMKALLSIEKSLGRTRGELNAPRTLDLDLLIYGNNTIETPGLKVPHPRMHARAFVLRPLAELAPEWVHPKLKKTVRTFLQSLPPGGGGEVGG